MPFINDNLIIRVPRQAIVEKETHKSSAGKNCTSHLLPTTPSRASLGVPEVLCSPTLPMIALILCGHCPSELFNQVLPCIAIKLAAANSKLCRTLELEQKQ